MKRLLVSALVLAALPAVAHAASQRVWECQGKYKRELLKVNLLRKRTGIAATINTGKGAMNTLATFPRLREGARLFQSADYRPGAAGFRLAISARRGTLAGLPGALKRDEMPSPPLRGALLSNVDMTIVLRPAFAPKKVIPIRAKLICAPVRK